MFTFCFCNSRIGHEFIIIILTKCFLFVQCLVFFLGSSSVSQLRALVQEDLGLDICLSLVTFSKPQSIFLQNRSNNRPGGRTG